MFKIEFFWEGTLCEDGTQSCNGGREGSSPQLHYHHPHPPTIGKFKSWSFLDISFKNWNFLTWMNKKIPGSENALFKERHIRVLTKSLMMECD